MTALSDLTPTTLTGGQRTVLAVGLARAHDLSIDIALGYVDTLADLLPELPEDTLRRCACGCGQPVGPNDHWASRACFIADEGPDHGDGG